MKVTTTASLNFVISKFCPVTTLQIKRKTVKDDVGYVKRWWFVIHAPENVLLNLESEWEQIQLQTGWKLESCFRPLQPMVRCITGTPVTLEKSNNERNPDKSISKVTLPEVDSSDNEQEFITPVVACSGDENDTANAQAVSNDDHAASVTTPFLEV